MKKLSLALALILLVTLLSACTSDTITGNAATPPAVALTDATSTTEPAAAATLAPTPEPTSIPTQSPPKDNAVGSRKNPTPIGIKYDFTLTNSDGEGAGKLSVVEIVRGADAMTIAKEANQFNDPPPDGYELLLAKFLFELDEWSGEVAYTVSDWGISYFDDTYSEITERCSVAGLEKYSGDVYDGGRITGWVYTLVPVDSVKPTARYGDNIWFALYQ